MPARRWAWQARTSAMIMADKIPYNHMYAVLFCSSVVPLSELLGLRPDLQPVRKIVYFHENHLALDIKTSTDLRYQLGYNEIMSCLAADQVWFNSKFNQRSFLARVNNHMAEQCESSLDLNIEMKIKYKSEVVYYPLDLNSIDIYLRFIPRLPTSELHIVWPHRWEFDKHPKMFYRVIRRLEKTGFQFRVAMFPESFMGKPTEKELMRYQCNTPRLIYFEDVQKNLKAYYTILKRADVIVSTAETEFFCSQILEGMYCDLIPVVPRLPVYVELFKNKVKEIYDSEDHLYQILATLCRKKQSGESLRRNYKHLTYAYESKKWMMNMMNIVRCTLD